MTTDAMRDASNEAYARLDKEITSLKSAIGDLSQRITEAVGDFGAIARKRARRGVRNARAGVDSAVADAADRVSAVTNAAQQRPRRLATRCRTRSRSARCRWWLSP